MAEISGMQLAGAVLDIVPTLDPEVVTIRIVTDKLAAHFGVAYEEMRMHRAAIKRLVMSEFNSGDDNGDRDREKENVATTRARKSNRISDDDDDDDEDEDEEANEEVEEEAEQPTDEAEQPSDDSESDAPKKRRRSSLKAVPAKRKASASAKKAAATPPAKKARQSADSPGMAALKEMARAARLLSPRVYAALKKLKSESEQEELVRDLLRKGGVRFSGRFPQKREIESVRKKKDMERDMEGIDTSLIIDDTSDRPRRASRSAGVSYADQLHVQPDSDDDAEQAPERPEETNGDDSGDEDDDDDAPKSKRTPAVARRKRVEEDEEEEEDASKDDDASESSEAEF